MQAIFECTPIQGSLVPENEKDYKAYLIHRDGIKQTVRFKDAVLDSEKQKMYAYFHGVIVDMLIECYTDNGYPGVTEGKVKYEMKKMFASNDILDINGKEVLELIDLSKMSKGRLLKFVKDVLHFMEEIFGVQPPDSEKYLRMKYEKK